MSDLLFSPHQVFIILCIAQVSYLFFYILFRAGDLPRAMWVLSYLLLIFGGLSFDLAMPFYMQHKSIFIYSSIFFWLFLPYMSYIVIIQIVKLSSLPALRHIAALAPFFIVSAAAFFFTQTEFLCGHKNADCREGRFLVAIFLLCIFAFLVLLSVWLQKPDFEKLYRDRIYGRQRYWIILCLIFVNVVFIAGALFFSLEMMSYKEWQWVRHILSAGFVYLVATSFLRIYPLPVFIRKAKKNHHLFDDSLTEKLNYILNVEKLYQETGFGRKDLARELGINEATASRLVNSLYECSIPELLNRRRLEEAKEMIKTTTLDIQDIARETGFASLTTFNRVFKAATGKTPSEYKMTSRNN